MTEIVTKDPDLRELAQRILGGLASRQELLRAPEAEVRAIKSDSGAVHYRSVATTPKASQVSDNPRRRMFVASDESVDRMGDIIRVKGWDLTNLEANPIALAYHVDVWPIGNVYDMKKSRRNGKPVLLEGIEYAAKEVSEYADGIFKLVDAGVVRAVSVGFIPHKTVWPESPEQREEWGLGARGCVYEEQEQLELSQVTVPANPAALGTKRVAKALNDMVKRGEVRLETAQEIMRAARHWPGRTVHALGAPAAPPPADPPAEAAAAAAAPEPTPSVGTTATNDPNSIVITSVQMGGATLTPETPAEQRARERDEAIDKKLDQVLAQLADLSKSMADAGAPARAAAAAAAKHVSDAPRSVYEKILEGVGQAAGSLKRQGPGGAT